jgi:hypothetical protein
MPPSNTSSPLSDAASLPNTNDDDIVIVNGSGPSRSPSPNGGRPRSRSQTSSTVQRRPSSNGDSDLSDLSDEDEQEEVEELENDSDGDEEDVAIVEEERGRELSRSRLPSTGYRNSAGVAMKASPGQRYVKFPYPMYS